MITLAAILHYDELLAALQNTGNGGTTDTSSCLQAAFAALIGAVTFHHDVVRVKTPCHMAEVGGFLSTEQQPL